MNLVEVEWIDSHTGDSWVSLKQARATAADNNALRMLSAGYLIADTPDYLLLAGTVSQGVTGDDDLVNGTMQIPRACVVDVRVLAAESRLAAAAAAA